MTVQHTETPCRKHEKTGAREKYSDDPDRQLQLLTGKAEGKNPAEHRRGQNSNEHKNRNDQPKQRTDCSRHTVGFLAFVLCKQTRIDRNEGCRQGTFTEEILEEVRYPKSCVEG